MWAPQVSHPDHDLDAPIKGFDDLVLLFHEAGKPRDAFRIGPEMEKFGIRRDTLRPIPYDGADGILAIFRALAGRDGWSPEAEKEGGPTLALSRGGAQITLEPGGQLELSGAAAHSIHEVCTEFRAHLRELAPISRELGIVWLGLGFHPFARREDFAWVPKSRYPVMREYLPTRGGHGLDMMLRTSTVQANFDFENEADAMRKMRVALALGPATTAIFANSPWFEGRAHGGLTYRGRVWLDVDPDRTGLLPTLWKKGAGFHDYVDWALDAPMFLFKRGSEVIANTGQTFRSFWKNGFQGHHARQSDWQTHLNTLFPEVRLKRTIEIRGADAQTLPTRCALPALWTGIFYDERALAEAEALTAPFTYGEVSELRERAWKTGLRTPFRGAPLAELAARVLEIAEGGLEWRARKNAKGKDERVHLARLKELVAKGRTPADQLLEAVEGAPDFARAVVEKAELKET
jgi:glutamate--cysteine ligase